MSTHDSAAARALFREGVACADGEDWACAADRFARARQVRPSPVLAYNLGHALIQMGRFVEGTEILTQLLREPSLPDGIRADAEQTLETSAPRIGRLEVRADGPIDRTVFTVDGRDLAPSLLGTTIPVDPGDRVVEARRSGEVVASAQIRAIEGQLVIAELTLPPLPPESASAASDGVMAERGAVIASLGNVELSGQRQDSPHADDGPWIALGISGAVVVVGGAIVLGIVLSQPSNSVFDGNLGHVEVGR